MSTTFPRTTRSRLGYNVEQVEEFLEEARRAYGAEPGRPTVVTSANIRHTAFAMQKGGYETGQVDAALERLEDAFASRERELRIRERGEEEWYSSARDSAQEILDRLARPGGERFDRIRGRAAGYSVQQVDAFSDRLTRYFQDGELVAVEEVRAVSFSSQRGGYREAQVDAVLDAVVDVMLAVRA